jgi:hypothetical protein
MRRRRRKGVAAQPCTAASRTKMAASCCSIGTSTTTTSTRTNTRRVTSSGKHTRVTGRSSTSFSRRTSSRSSLFTASIVSSQRRGWMDTPRFAGTHPIVHVALGSHANYLSAGVHPTNPVCVPPAALAILAQLKLPPPSDYAFPGETEGPPAADGRVMPIHQIAEDHPSWTSFPGFWGELQYFHGPGPIGTVPFGASPQGPGSTTPSGPIRSARSRPGPRVRVSLLRSASRGSRSV